MYHVPRCLLIITVVTILLSSAGFGYATEGKSEEETLRGVKSLCVIVHGLDYEFEEYGLTQDKIQKDFEAKLRTAGIEVLSKEESLKEPGAPFLSLMVGTLRAFTTKDTEFYFISIVTKFRQNVYLERVPKKKVSGITTWSNTRFGINFVHNIRSEVDGAIDKFISAYLSVNPK
jgi:hypothetical protein